MCGFVGLLALAPGVGPTESWVRGMLETIAHRGPDDEGILVDDHAALGFRRLSILDLTHAGNQPMTSRDGMHSLVFNGEIYNYLELRAELQSRGHRFASSGDTEVLLAAYREWGARCVDKLVGMFALCVVDRANDTYFIARDRFGIKPLFYLRHASGILIASELKAIRASGLWGGELNLARFARFLSFGRSENVDEDADTYLDGVHQLLAGYSCTIKRQGTMQFERYWAPDQRESRMSDKRVLEEFTAAFDDSIRLHRRADVPVGVMLSGGMDSTSIACAMAATGLTEPLHAFCYVSDAHDEVQQLNDVVRQTGAVQHVTRGLEPENFWARLRQLVWHHDEPVHSTSALMGFELYRMAAEQGIKVVLCGQGADETLGGYHDLFDHLIVSEVFSGRLVSAWKQSRHTAALTGRETSTLALRTAALIRAHAMASRPAYRRAAAGRRLNEGEARVYLSPDIRDLARPMEERPTGQTLSSALIRNMTRSPLPHYLRAEDRNSMAHGVEARVPFLDHRLVDLAMRIPPRWKMYDGWNKRVLREAMVNRIPESVRLRREKFGFPTAAAEWFAGPLAGGLRSLVEDSHVMRSGWFDQRAVRQALGRHMDGRPATKLLFNLAQLDAWFELHANGWQLDQPRSTRMAPVPV